VFNPPVFSAGRVMQETREKLKQGLLQRLIDSVG
jgi:hypothetical protein